MRIIRLAAACLAAATLLAGPAAAQSSKRAIALDDLAKLRSVSDPQVSPDGRWVAYTVGTVDAEKDTRDTDLWMVSWDGAQSVRLTATADSRESSPRWSPDNRYLAFLATRGGEDDKKLGGQVWLLDRRGGEAERLTSIKGGVSEFAWSPDASRLALVVDDPDPNEEPETLEGWERKTPPPIVIDRYHFKQDRVGYLRALHQHLAVFDMASRKEAVVTPGRFDEAAPAWSPDGRLLAFVSNRTADPDRNENTDIFVVEAKAGAEPRQLTTYGGTDGGRPSWSPDGKWIAYVRGEETKYAPYAQDALAVVPSAGGEPTILTASFDRPVSGNLVWTGDSRGLYFTADDDRVTCVAKVAAAGGPIEKVTTGPRVVSSLSRRADGEMALVSGTSDEPGEVYALEGGALRRLTHQNDALMAELALGPTEDFTSKSQDGTEVHGLMVKPASFVAGRRYPTILLIHGGPNGQDDHSFSFDRQYFAAHGYVVISVNYRGSSGRGTAYSKAIFADWGHLEVMDLLGAVDHVVSDGVADPDRLGLGGWSYGGILTDATIAADPRFKAAVSGAGSSLELTMYGVDQYIVQYQNEMGLPWKGLDTWLKVSAAFLHADRIRTPTLFMGGDKDFNVPLVGGEQMYQALKSLGVATELVIYPGQYHGITVPSYQRDRLARDLAWFDKSTSSRPAAP